MWDVTPQILKQVVNNYDLAKARGCDCNLVWGHSDDARDLADGDIDDVFFDGETLYADLSTDDANEARRIKRAKRVSVRISPEFHDGHGNIYHEHLLHVGIVQHPVVTGQGPFIELSLIKEPKNMAFFRSKKPRDLADDAAAEGGDSAVADAMGGTMPTASKSSFEELKPILAKALDVIAKFAGNDVLKLGSTVTDETLLPEFTLKVDFADGMVGGSSPAAPAGGDTATEVLTPQDLKIKTLEARNLALEQAAQLRDLELKSKGKVEFSQRLDALSTKGVLDASLRKSLENAGEKFSYDLSLLAPFEKMVGGRVPTQSRVRSLSTAAEPSLGDDKQVSFEQLNPKEQEQKIKSFWG